MEATREKMGCGEGVGDSVSVSADVESEGKGSAAAMSGFVEVSDVAVSDGVAAASSAVVTTNTLQQDTLPMMPPPEHAPYFSAHGLELRTLVGFAYRGVDLEVARGQVAAVRGRNGSGKTALLLTLAGRMKSTGGTLTVDGFQLPRQRRKVERRVGLGLFAGLNDLQDSLTTAYAVGAEFELYGRNPRREHVTDYLRSWQLEDVANVRVKDLTAEKLAELGIALAFAGEPDAIVVDDIEDQLTMSQSKGLMELLLRAARERNAAIVVGVIERDLAAMAATCVYLEKEGE